MLQTACITGLAIGSALLLYAEALQAGTYTAATVSVTTSVSANCTVTTSSLDFGAYDPIGTQRTNDLDVVTNQISIACVQGSVPTIALGPGNNSSHAVATTRSMSSGTDYLDYELYQPSNTTPNASCSFSVVWGGGNLFSPGTPSTKASRSYRICARVRFGQDPSVGTYTDTVTATVNF
jgi:spore coat protein U-like protein